MSDIHAIAQALASAHRGKPIVAGANDGPINVKDAYAVQDEVLRILAPGRHPVAWKVSPPRGGADPLMSPVPAQGVLSSPATVCAGERIVLGVECEIAFRFAEAPTVDLADAHAPLDGIGEAIVLIELCETRIANWSDASPLWRLADFQSHGAFVLGTGTTEWRALDYARQEAQLRVNGRSVARGVGTHPTRNLAEMVAWSVRHCARRGMPLQAGDIVTTGTWTGLVAVSPVEDIVASFPGIGESRLRLEH